MMKPISCIPVFDGGFMKYFFVIITLATYLFSNSSEASISKMTCQVFDSTETPITKSISFVASSRTSHSIPVIDDKVIYLRWSYYTSPVSVLVVSNPSYPWNLPWKTKTLNKGIISEVQDGKIKGSFKLDVIEIGLKLYCEQENL